MRFFLLFVYLFYLPNGEAYPPGDVRDLDLSTPTDNSIHLKFTAPGGDLYNEGTKGDS